MSATEPQVDTEGAAAALLGEQPLTALERLRMDVEGFLVREATLLEDCEFEAWLGLFHPDIRYWAPVRITREGFGDVVEEGGLCHFEDDYGFLELRIASLRSKNAWAEIPPSRTRRMITNVQVEGVEGDRVSVRSNFVVYRTRLADVENLFVGRRDDVLIRHRDSWRIQSRRILFDTVVLQSDNISILF